MCVDELSSEAQSDYNNIGESLYDRQQHGMLLDAFLQPVNIAQEVLDQHLNGIFSVAPGEGNSPVQLLTDETNEAKCFPFFFFLKEEELFMIAGMKKMSLYRYFNK